MRLVNVGTTNGDGSHLEEDFSFTDFGHRNLPEFDGERLECVMNDRGVCGHNA